MKKHVYIFDLLLLYEEIYIYFFVCVYCFHLQIYLFIGCMATRRSKVFATLLTSKTRRMFYTSKPFKFRRILFFFIFQVFKLLQIFYFLLFKFCNFFLIGLEATPTPDRAFVKRDVNRMSVLILKLYVYLQMNTIK